MTVPADAALVLPPRVTADQPAAVLLVDLTRREVLFANPLAEQLVPGLALPAPVDAWADAAGLPDLDGGLSARRPSDVSGVREPLWVVAVPLAGAPLLADCALVVLLPLHAAESGLEAHRQVRDRAVLATGLAFTVVDAQAEDMPLMWVNPAFTATTGFSAQEAVGRNCRFLQGPGTDPATVAELRRACAAGDAVTVTLLNYRKDGTAFWNQLAVSPITDGAGRLTHFVGVQIDVTDRRVAELESERIRGGLALLADATRALSSTLDPDGALDALARVVVPRVADWAVIDLLDDEGRLRQVSVRHASGREALVERYRALQPSRLGPRSPVTQVLQTGTPQLLTGLGRGALTWYAGEEEMLDVIGALGLRSSVVVPLIARQRVLGTLALVSTDRDYDAEDLALAADLGRRAGLMIDNARLYQREHDAAVLLQRSLLPELPVIPGVTSAARYLAGDTAAQVGGDFYEVLGLPGGSIGLAVGDVVGHDLAAAAAMGHLRGLLRACAYDTAAGDAGDGGSPATVLERVDRLVQGLAMGGTGAPLATVLYARLDPLPDGWLLTCSSAGHPPLVLREPDGTARVLDVEPDTLLGVLPDARRTATTVWLQRGSTLLAYTDGLVERRHRHLDEGLAALVATVQAAPVDATPQQVVDRVTTALAGGGGAAADDDIALLALRLDT